MTEPTLAYRVWQDGMAWRWELISQTDEVIASGAAQTCTKARSAAFHACLEFPDGQPDAK